jgi:predicted secreted protein
MKTKKSLLIIGLVAISIVAAGTVIGMNLAAEKQKNQQTPSVHYLTIDDANSTVYVKNGETVNLTLPDYGDGGYVWMVTQCDEAFLHQTKQFNWGGSGMLGDFGKDTWVFTTVGAGSTTLELVCKRLFDVNDTCQTFVVTVNIV